MISNILKVALASFVLSISSLANASLITVEFNNGDSLDEWGVDRSAPDGFEIINNELVMSIAGPSNQSNVFYDTHGMNLNIGESTYLSIDMFINSAWDNDERYGGMWAQIFDYSDATSGWPIIEFQGTEGINAWDNTGWQTPTVDFNYDAFNTLTLEITDNGLEYLINDTLFYIDLYVEAAYLGTVILNAKYEGSDFAIRYDNLVYGTVDAPEPTTLAIFALGMVGLAARRFKKL